MRIRVAALSALLLTLSSPLAHAQTLEQKLDMLKEFRRFYPRFKETPDKVEAVFTLKTADCPEAAEELIKLMKDKEPEVKAAARKVLGGFKEPGTLGALADELDKSKDNVRRAAIIEILGLARYVPAAPKLGTLLEDKTLSPEARFHLIKAMTALDAKGQAPRLAQYLKDPDYSVRVAACDALGEMRVKDVGKELVPLLKDPQWQVKVAAIHAVNRIRVQEAVESLIEILGDEGRFKIDAAAALSNITDRDFGLDQAAWKKNWASLTALGFKIPSDEEVAKSAEARAKANAGYAKAAGKKGSYHNIPIVSTNVLFIIDVSGSMSDLVVEREKFKGAGYDSFEKIEIVKTELMNTLKGLDDNVNFNILTFATKVKRWKDWLVPGNITNKAAAIAHVKGLKPLGAAADPIPMGGMGGGGLDEGKTNTHGALMAAFDIDPAKDVVLTGNAAPKNKLDTVFFLSDGRPSTGKYVDTNEILAEVLKINATRKLVIHTIAIGEFQRDFMKRLAEENGGVFVDLGQ